MCVVCIPAVHSSVAVCLLFVCGLTIEYEKKAAANQHERAVCVCVRADRRPPGPGSCLPHGGRGRRPQCPANSHHARHRLPLLLFQLPLRPQPVAATTQTGVCRSHESQGCSGANEGVCLFFCLHSRTFSSHRILCALQNLCFELFRKVTFF